MGFGSRMSAGLCVLVMCGGICAAGPGRPPTESAYEKLDEVKLAVSLGEFGMTELLKALRDEMAEKGDAVSRLTAEAQLDLILASQFDDPAAAAEAMDAALSKLREAAALEPAEDAPASKWIKHFRVRFVLARTLALRKAQPYAQAVLYMGAGPSDRLAFERITAEAMDALQRLENSMENRRAAWTTADGRQRLHNLMVKVPQLKRFKAELAFHSAWIYFYRGLALPDASRVEAARTEVQAAQDAPEPGDKIQLLNAALEAVNMPVEPPEGRPMGVLQQTCSALRGLRELIDKGEAEEQGWRYGAVTSGLQNTVVVRRTRLQAAADGVQQFIDDPSGGLKYWSLLLQGTVYRELGEHNKARTKLDAIRGAADTPAGLARVGPQVLGEAMFQLARNEIERPEPDAAGALEAIELFKETAGRAAAGNPARRQFLEVRSGLLRVYLHERMARDAAEDGNAALARERQRQAAYAMFAFANEREALQGPDLTAEQRRRAEWLAEYGEAMQSGLFVLVSGHGGLKLDDDVAPLYADALRLARLYGELDAVKTDEARREALASILEMLEGEPADDAVFEDEQARKLTERIYAAARWEAGHLLNALLADDRAELVNRAMELRRELAADAMGAGALEEQLKGIYDRLLEPAEMWEGLARRYPEHPQALAAGLNAIGKYQGLMPEPGAEAPAVPLFLQEDYLDVLQYVVGRWPTAPDVRKYGLQEELAWLLAEMSVGDEPTAERLENMMRAIPLFEREEPGDANFVANHRMALVNRTELYENAEQWRGVAEAVEDEEKRERLLDELDQYTGEAGEQALIERLGRFSEQALKLRDDAEGDRLEEIRSSGSVAALDRAMLLYERGREHGRPADMDKALTALESLRENWPDTEAAAEARVLVILVQIEAGRATAEELEEKIDALLKEYPEEAERLLGALYRIRDKAREEVYRLKRLTQTRAVQRQLGQAAQRYLKFSEYIYDYLLDQEEPDPGQVYEAQAIYADALLMAGQEEEALAQYQRLRETDQAEIEKARAKIREQVAEWLERLEAARGELERLKDLAAECAEAFAANESITPLTGHVRRLAAGYEDQDDPELLAALFDRGVRDYRKQAAQAVAADATVLYGVARCQQALGRFDEALALYRRVANGLAPTHPSPPERPELGTYWEVQLRLVRAWLSAQGGDAESMSALVTYIRQLGAEDEREFRDVFDEAQRRAE